MNINWKLRFQNKVTLTAMVVQAVALIYAALGIFGIVPAIGENQILDLGYMVIELLCLLGIVVDPTTNGVGDSAQAMSYTAPKK